MTDHSQSEIEVKFAIGHHGPLRQRLLQLGGRLLHDRHLERNWRFDTADRILTNQHQVLRVRQAERGTLTFKDAGEDPLIRTEIEVEVDDPIAARTLLEALGYRPFQVYEKYREVFVLDDAEVMLDQLPFGSFVEIEASDPSSLQSTSRRLGLAWRHRVLASYLELFDRLQAGLPTPASRATFDAFRDLPPITLADLDLENAWIGQHHGETDNDG
jgi:adenylate cyclase class 2